MVDCVVVFILENHVVGGGLRERCKFKTSFDKLPGAYIRR